MKKKDSLGITPFDAAEYLRSEEDIAAYLNAVSESGDIAALQLALGDIARARGMADLSARTGLGRESLYKTFKPDTKPRLETILKIAEAVGVRMRFEPSGKAPEPTQEEPHDDRPAKVKAASSPTRKRTPGKPARAAAQGEKAKAAAKHER